MRYLTIRSTMAIILWSMIYSFRFRLTFIFSLLLVFGLRLTDLKAQATLDANPTGGGNVTFTLDNLPPLPPGPQPGFGSLPFYDFFIIYADGNFQKHGYISSAPFSFPYSYRNMTNNYPVVGHLNLRKDDDPPPPDMIVIPPPPPVPPPLIKPTDFIQANGGAAFIAPVAQALPGPTSIPESPMLSPIATSMERVEWGISHSAFDTDPAIRRDVYYIENEDVHIFPIAYRPNVTGPDDTALLLFFYNDTDFYNSTPGAGNQDFTFRTNIFTQTTLAGTPYGGAVPFNTGTILPNYYDINFGGLPNNIINRMSSINEITTSTPSLNGAFTTGVNSTDFQNCIAYEIQGDELATLGTFSTAIPGGFNELRLFHFLQANLYNEYRTDYYPFLAMLYNKDTTFHTNLISDQGDIDLFSTTLMNDIPPQIVYDSDTFNFTDAHFLAVRGNEPHDPNELVIEDICKNGENYLVQFKLDFCNDGTAPASGATILLRTIDNLVSDYELIDCSPGTCTEGPGPCSNFFPSIWPPIPPPDPIRKKYCFIPVGDLSAGSCGYIRFTVNIGAADINELITRPVLEFCLQFAPIPFVGPPYFCGSNIVLEDTVCCATFGYKKEKEKEKLDTKTTSSHNNKDNKEGKKKKVIKRIDCKQNSIWENRDQPCPQKPCWCCCWWWLCWLLIIISAFSLIYFCVLFYKKR